MILFVVLGALVWANIVEDFYKDVVVLGIMVISGLYLIYLIVDNILHLLRMENDTVNHK